MSISPGRRVANGAVALSLLFGLAACDDDPHKIELVNDLATRSIATCVLQESAQDQKPFEARLRDVLERTSTSSLEFLKSNGITVCLDKRLQNQQSGFFSYRAEGIYYPEARTISLWDNGMDHAQSGWTGWSATSRGPNFLNSFPNNFGGWLSMYNSVSEARDPAKAYHYTTTVRCGKSCTSTTHHYSWSRIGGDDSFFVRNPHLEQPSLRP